jgi:outer membrane protein
VKRFRALAVVTALMALCTALPGARAAGAETLKLKLEDAIRMALDFGTAARLATTRTAEASARALEAHSALGPQVSFQGLAASESINLQTFGFDPGPGQPPVAGPFNVVEGRVIAALNLIDVAAKRRWQAAQAGVQVSEEDRRRTENEVAAAVATLYVAVGRSSTRIEAIRADVELFDKLRQLALDQKTAGVGTRLDTTRAEVQLARQRQALLVAINQRDVARLALLRAIGADLGTEIELADPLAPAVPAPALAAALAEARQSRPEMALYDRRLAAARLTLAAAEAEKLPTLGTQIQAVENGNRVSDLAWNRTIGATVTIPLWTGRRTEAHIASAKAALDQVVLEQHDSERQIEQEVRRALLNWENARSRAELAGQSVKLAQDEVEQSSDRFKNGVAPSIEVDNAQTSLTAARDSQIDALADQADARYDLERATGQIRNLIPTPMPAETPAAGAASNASTPSASMPSDLEKSSVRRRDPK